VFIPAGAAVGYAKPEGEPGLRGDRAA